MHDLNMFLIVVIIARCLRISLRLSRIGLVKHLRLYEPLMCLIFILGLMCFFSVTSKFLGSLLCLSSFLLLIATLSTISIFIMIILRFIEPHQFHQTYIEPQQAYYTIS